MAGVAGDIVNAAFEAGGGIMLTFNCLAVWRDKKVAGVRWWATAFFALWGAWNLYYYPSLGQWYSFAAGCYILAANLVWVGLQLYYRER